MARRGGATVGACSLASCSRWTCSVSGSLFLLYQEPGSYTYYGLLGELPRWQFLFLMIAWRPAELRLAMIPAVLEELLWVITLVTLYLRGGLTRRATRERHDTARPARALFALADFGRRRD